jgi:hypothetical protein
MHLIDSVLACIADDHNGKPCDDVKVSGLKGFFSLYVVNDSKHHDKPLTDKRVKAYMSSLNGRAAPTLTPQAFVDSVQTMHAIHVLCCDEDLTSQNYHEMMRCDCKG